MLNSCFQFALEKRNVWILLRELDLQFEIDVEDCIIIKYLSIGCLKLSNEYKKFRFYK